MGRISEAIQVAQRAGKVFPDSVQGPDVGFWLPCIIQTRILRHTGRNKEALQLLRRGVADGSRKYLTAGDKIFQFHLYFLLVELATTWGIVACPERALKVAERVVRVCRENAPDDYYVDGQKCTLVHSLTTLSNCLSTAGREDEALTVSREAVSIYTQNMAHMWGDFFLSGSRPLVSPIKRSSMPRKPPNSIAS
ncbi:hypothetical protein B0H19DRAFT_1096022 [Mycena capillaripes]|nr:hypothetical protein B0H19DRAFT_1096022 [Mycena capillaripes]